MKHLRQYIRVLLRESLGNPKAIFMAGAPGSGKSTVIRKLGLSGKFNIINPDDIYEAALAEEGIPFDQVKMFETYRLLKDELAAATELGDPNTIQAAEDKFQAHRKILSRNMVLFNKARKGAKALQAGHLENREDILIDGTGGNFNEISKQLTALHELGYDVAMIFISVPMETSLDRNDARGARGGRRLPKSSIIKSWTAVNRNREVYEGLFEEDFFFVDASEDMFDESVEIIKPGMQRFMR